jgi:hypothetical protein
LNWLGHVERMTEDNNAKKIKRWKPCLKDQWKDLNYDGRMTFGRSVLPFYAHYLHNQHQVINRSLQTKRVFVSVRCKYIIVTDTQQINLASDFRNVCQYLGYQRCAAQKTTAAKCPPPVYQTWFVCYYGKINTVFFDR